MGARLENDSIIASTGLYNNPGLRRTYISRRHILPFYRILVETDYTWICCQLTLALAFLVLSFTEHSFETLLSHGCVSFRTGFIVTSCH